jgi:threonyl-tRNA synthetase editing subunit
MAHGAAQMRALLFDAREYRAEKPTGQIEHFTDCLVVLITFEERDSSPQVNKLVRYIRRVSSLYGTARVVLGPFAHLSHNLMNSQDATKLLKALEQELRLEFYLLVSEFGAEKGLLLDVRMGKENIKYRSF